MRSHRRCIAAFASLLGCAGEPSTSSTDTQAGSESGVSGSGVTSTDGSETNSGVPPCDPSACMIDCMAETDECGQPLISGCSSEGVCECVQAQACPPCVDAECPPWTECSGPTGVCMFSCFGEIEPIIDPPGSCRIPLVEFPPFAIAAVYMHVDGSQASAVETCDDEAMYGLAWTWESMPPVETMVLCPALCMALESATSVELGYGIPCE